MRLSSHMLTVGLASLWVCATAWSQDAPAAKDLPMKDSLTQYGITWKFEKPVPVGQFVTGDYYVVGPAKVVSVDPKPRLGLEIKDEEVDKEEARRTKEAKNRLRNGSMVNPPTDVTSAYDSRMRDCKVALAVQFPLDLKPGDSLVSTVSLPKLQQNVVLTNSTRDHEYSPLQAAAVLTCLDKPVPADAFRPSCCDLKKDKIHRAKGIRWNLLPSVPSVKASLPHWDKAGSGHYDADGRPRLEWVERMFERPWLDHVYSWTSRELHPSENLPGYGREIGRAVSYGALLLCTDLPKEKKEKLCLRLVQVGIDNWGVATRCKKGSAGGWPAQGGFGNGRKLPIVLAALLLDDPEMKQIKKYAPEASFGEDEHTEFGPSWTGAAVRFTGQYPLSGATDRGPYEHLTPDKWPGPNKTMSEGYRRCCTSVCWVGQALTVRLMKAESLWDHDAFFAYVDRWMYEDDANALEEIKKVYPDLGGIKQGTTSWDPWVDAMWAKYRTAPGMPATDAWTKGRAASAPSAK